MWILPPALLCFWSFVNYTGVPKTARAENPPSSLPGSCWHFSGLSQPPCSGCGCVAGQRRPSARVLCSLWAINLSHTWFPLAFPICTRMDWTVRKEEPAKRRSLGAWMAVRRQSTPKPHWIALLDRNKLGVKPLKVWGCLLQPSLLWPLQQSPGKRDKAIYSQSTLFSPQNTYL